MSASVIKKTYALVAVMQKPDGSFTASIGEKQSGQPVVGLTMNFDFATPDADDLASWGNAQSGGTIEGSFTFIPKPV